MAKCSGVYVEQKRQKNTKLSDIMQCNEKKCSIMQRCGILQNFANRMPNPNHLTSPPLPKRNLFQKIINTYGFQEEGKIGKNFKRRDLFRDLHASKTVFWPMRDPQDALKKLKTVAVKDCNQAAVTKNARASTCAKVEDLRTIGHDDEHYDEHYHEHSAGSFSQARRGGKHAANDNKKGTLA